ncbi:hypothetical protein [Maribacter sp. 4U21]|uniref:hypothetical protein n=1 Tax=Maribacter sp. 4U21 TaxID=1889779 RepID=UPI00117D890E|nr:hypothetical protein [Maribacter sp. 4U21]
MGNDLYGACGQTNFEIPVVSTSTGNTTYRIVSGPADSPLAPFPTAISNPTGILIAYHGYTIISVFLIISLRTRIGKCK